ncbi:MAG TPA: ADP-glyceromanno-heptose 6-epimerase [Segetibacter sp.]|jgi:ADP-L-glycero-D-manno-heptose 6-epimerase
MIEDNHIQSIQTNLSAVNNSRLIVVTGAAGFIGSCMVQYLNECGYENLVLVDDFGVEEKRKNWEGKQFEEIVERYNFFNWLQTNERKINFVIHLGARTDTTEFDYAVHEELNVQYSKDVWEYCTKHEVPLIYASSAATYGAGELGYDDDHNVVEKLQPLNPYGISKNEFDKWALNEKKHPPFWAGLKFFNVYGPNEAHKKRMASVIFHSFNQIKKEGAVKLFKSYKEGYDHGEQLRDFVYVKDVVKVILWMMKNIPPPQLSEKVEVDLENVQLKEEKLILNDGGGEVVSHSKLISGLYNLGTGNARTFNELVSATFHALDLQPNIQYIEMPDDIKDKYQYYTEANITKLRLVGYQEQFYSLEDGISDYLRNYLTANKMY